MVVNFSATARHLLRQAQRACCHTGYAPATVPLDHEQMVAAIAEDLDLDEATVCCYAQVYRTKSLAGYLATERPGCRGLLTSTQLAGLNQELGQTLYTDCRTIADWPVTTHGVRHSVSGLTDLLHRLDANALGALSYHLTTTAPRQADAGQQTAFLTDTLVPLLAQAEAGEAMVCFVDAAHPHPRHPRVDRNGQETAPAHRQRPRTGQPYAALNAHAPTQAHLNEIDCVNAQNTQRRYGKLLAAHPEGPVYVVCDNIRYYQNKAPTEWLTDKRLVPVFLPPYSPNLNLMEWLWKFSHQKIINTTFYRTKSPLKTAVLNFFDRLPKFGHEFAPYSNLEFRLLDSYSAS